MTRRYAVDCASFAGTLTQAEAQKIKDMGFSKAIVNLWGRDTAQSQIDAFQSVGMEVDGDIYFYFAQDPVIRIDSLLGNLAGRTINFMWLDWEDDTVVTSIPSTINYMQRAVDGCANKVYSGMYSREEWWLRRTGNTMVFAGMAQWDATNDQKPDMSIHPYGGLRPYMEQYAFDVELLPGKKFDLNVYDEADVPPQPQPVPTTKDQLITTLNTALVLANSLP